MKRLLLTLAFASPLFAQSIVGWIEGPKDFDFKYHGHDATLNYGVWQNSDGSKTLVLEVRDCEFQQSDQPCPKLDESAARPITIVQLTVAKFDAAYAEKVRHIQFLATATRNPQAIILDGYSDNRLLFLDLKTFEITNPVTVPNGARLFAMRPSAVGPSNEAWTAHAGIGNQITIANLDTSHVEGAIPTNLNVTTNDFAPVNIVFSNSGKTAYYTIRYLNPDANGNRGAMLIFDADTRTLKSTVLLSNRPDAFLMAPDGLTAYLIGDRKIVYYDVLSGTSDLVASFPGDLLSPYQMFAHPDGNRIFFFETAPNSIAVFDLSQRKVVNQFPIAFPIGQPLRLFLNQDGSQLDVVSNKGEGQSINPISGKVVNTFQLPPTTIDVFITPKP